MDKFETYEYKRSRKSYTIQSAVEYFIALLVSDAFLAKILTYIGISDSLIGIISSFVSLAWIVQIMSIFMLRTKMNTKKMVMLFDTFSIFIFMFLFLVPFTHFSASVKTGLVIAGILIAYVSKYIVYSIFFKWANSFVAPDKRAVFSANKEIISLVSGIIFTMVIGYIIDKYEGMGNLEGGFLFIAISILILNICNFICYVLIEKEPETHDSSKSKKLSEVLKYLTQNKGFLYILIPSILWEMAKYSTIGFLGVFKTNDLVMSIFLIQVVNMIGNLLRVAVSKPFGKFSDKYSFAKGIKLAMYIAAAAFFVNIFTTNATWYLIIVHTILFNICMAGINQNLFNISYSYISIDYLTEAIAIKNSISGVCGFAASLVAGKILSIVQANGNMLFGVNIYGQQILSFISFIFVVVAIIFIQKFVEKQEVMKQ